MLIGETVVDSNLVLVPVSTFEKEGSVVGLFFSAHWCPPSRYVHHIIVIILHLQLFVLVNHAEHSHLH